MKKKIFLKIFLILFSLLLFVFFISYAFINMDKQSETIEIYKNILQNANEHTDIYFFEKAIKNCFFDIILHFLCSLPALVLFLILTFFDFDFLTKSTIKCIKDNYSHTKNERLKKKQAKLAREIAEKQAELEKMSKEE